MCPWCLSTGGVLPLLLPITAACLNFPHSDSLSLSLSLFAQNPVQLWAGYLCNCEQDFLCNCEQGFQDFCAIVRRIFCARTVSRIFCRRDEGIIDGCSSTVLLLADCVELNIMYSISDHRHV
jgi:hypothetical protein